MAGDNRHDSKEREYTNGEITVYWRPSKCIHVTTCYRELIEVFNPGRRPWINMQGAPTDEIIRVVNLCPTQALSYKWNKDIEDMNKPNTGTGEADASEDKPAETPAEVRVMKDGPLIIRGNFRLVGSSGNELSRTNHVSLCRCGRSEKMPFCDGSHRNIGFHAD